MRDHSNYLHFRRGLPPPTYTSAAAGAERKRGFDPWSSSREHVMAKIFLSLSRPSVSPPYCRNFPTRLLICYRIPTCTRYFFHDSEAALHTMLLEPPPPQLPPSDDDAENMFALPAN